MVFLEALSKSLTLLFILICEFHLSSASGETDTVKLDESRIPWAFSPFESTNLAKAEIDIYFAIVEYLDSLDEHLEILDSWIEDYEASAGKATEGHERKNAKAIAGHPLRTYRMMSRFTNEFPAIMSAIYTQMEDDLLSEINNLNQTFRSPLPNYEDVQDSADSIIRLQTVYDLKAKHLMNGIIGDTKTNVTLTLDQVSEIAERALSKKQYINAYDWLTTAQEAANKNSSNKVIFDKITQMKRILIKEHDELHNNITDENYYDLNLNRFNSKIVSKYTLEPEKKVQIRYFRDKRILTAEHGYMVLCNGDNFLNETEKSKLYCFYETKSHPVWTINPLKIEVHSWDPYLIQMYDVIGEKLIEYLTSNALPNLLRSEVVDFGNKSGYYSPTRTSATAYLDKATHPTLDALETVISHMTGLRVRNDNGEFVSEELQTAVYGPGCHFSEHLDQLEGLVSEEKGGDRLATFMYYLNNVQKGGRTAFPLIGTAIEPVKGSAVFWYGLKKNGTTDSRTLHGGCPIILGRKIVATKWIRYNSNFQTWKCSLNQME